MVLLLQRQMKKAQVLGFPVLTADKVIFGKVGIIIGLGDIYTKEVMRYLHGAKNRF